MTQHTSISIPDFTAALDVIHQNYVDKLGEQPRMRGMTNIYTSGRISLNFYKVGTYDDCTTISADSLEKLLVEAQTFVDSLPERQTRLNQEYLEAVAKLIDLGKESNIDEEYIAPLRATKQAMTDNLLAAPKSAPTNDWMV